MVVAILPSGFELVKLNRFAKMMTKFKKEQHKTDKIIQDLY